MLCVGVVCVGVLICIYICVMVCMICVCFFYFLFNIIYQSACVLPKRRNNLQKHIHRLKYFTEILWSTDDDGGGGGDDDDDDGDCDDDDDITLI